MDGVGYDVYYTMSGDGQLRVILWSGVFNRWAYYIWWNPDATYLGEQSFVLLDINGIGQVLVNMAQVL